MRILLFIIAVLLSFNSYSQQKSNIYVDDIKNFWLAYDQVKGLSDTNRQKEIIKKVYLDYASIGLQELVQIRHLQAGSWVKSINSYPRFWATIRQKTENVIRDTSKIKLLLTRFKYYYPEFKAPTIYFVIGCIKTGGTTSADHVLIGTEIATGDSTVNTEGQNSLIKNIFKESPGILGLVAHELGHTQQFGGDAEEDGKSGLLSYCLREGVCDFMAELLTAKPRITPYIIYGNKHEKQLWYKFKDQLFLNNVTNQWLYNGSTAKPGEADLGYFEGYTICKYYYRHAKNKKRVIKDMFQLDYTNKAALKLFLEKTGYANKYM